MGKGLFLLQKAPSCRRRRQFTPKCASQEKAFRALRSAAKGSAFGNRDFLEKIE
jgi:hypothetical protein